MLFEIYLKKKRIDKKLTSNKFPLQTIQYSYKRAPFKINKNIRA